MKIAQIAPLPKCSAQALWRHGTDRFLSDRGVGPSGPRSYPYSLSGDSVPDARLVACSDVALGLNPAVRDHLPHQVVMLEEVRKRAR